MQEENMQGDFINIEGDLGIGSFLHVMLHLTSSTMEGLQSGAGFAPF